MVLLTIVIVIIGAVFGLLAWAEWGKSKGAGIATLVVGIALVIFTGWANWATSFSNERTVVCEVIDKDRGSGDEYRVYTKNCGTLQNTNDWYVGKTNSVDVWGKIPKEGVVELHFVGITFGPFRMLPNILDARPVN